MAAKTRKTKKIAIGAMLIAFSVTILYLASFFNAIDLTISALSSLVIIFALIELGRSYSLMIYTATSVLSLLILPVKYVAVMYLLFCGIYPILKVYMERLPLPLAVTVKLLYFNLSLTGTLLAAKFILNLETYTGWLLVVFYLLANITFFLFDILLTRLVRLYFARFRKRLKIDKLLR